MARTPGEKLIQANKKARFEFEILDRYEAGMVLTGSEVKSLRAGKASFQDAYVRFENGEAFLCNVNIAPYENAGYAQHVPDRERKLLLHAAEIKLLTAKVEQKGLTVVPLRLYFKNGKIKAEIALARGKKTYDQRDDLKKRAMDRDMQRELKDR